MPFESVFSFDVMPLCHTSAWGKGCKEMAVGEMKLTFGKSESTGI